MIKNIRDKRTGRDALEVMVDLKDVQLSILPENLADLFWKMGDDQQATFLAEVARLTDECEVPGAIMQHDMISIRIDKFEDDDVRERTRSMLDQWACRL